MFGCCRGGPLGQRLKVAVRVLTGASSLLISRAGEPSSGELRAPSLLRGPDALAAAATSVALRTFSRFALHFSKYVARSAGLIEAAKEGGGSRLGRVGGSRLARVWSS